MLETVNDYLRRYGDFNAENSRALKNSLAQLNQHFDMVTHKYQRSPLITLCSSIQSLVERDFRERKQLKDIQDLLNKLRMTVLDQRLELITQNQKNQQLYEERKSQLLADKATNTELYQSKINSYDQVNSKRGLGTTHSSNLPPQGVPGSEEARPGPDRTVPRWTQECVVPHPSYQYQARQEAHPEGSRHPGRDQLLLQAN